MWRVTLHSKHPALGIKFIIFLLVHCTSLHTTHLIISSDSDPESRTLIIVSWHYLSLYTQLVPLSIDTWPTSSLLSSWISDHYTLANIKLLKRVVSLLGTGFYILLLIMVITMLHIFLVFKSCTCDVLVSFDINFVSSLCTSSWNFPLSFLSL